MTIFIELMPVIDDQRVGAIEQLQSGEEVLVTMKIDGIYSDNLHYLFRDMNNRNLGFGEVPISLREAPVEQLKATLFEKKIAYRSVAGELILVAQATVKVEVVPQFT